jgi:hypothetical protein
MTTPSPFTFGGVVAEATSTNKTGQVQLTEADRADLARAVTYFSNLPNTANLKFNMPTVQEADDYRAKIQRYAAEHNLSAGLPKFVDAHDTKAVTDPSSGKIVKPAKRIPANKIPRDWNVGTQVTFRFSPHRDDSTKASAVTTSTVAERAAASKTGAETAATAAVAAAKSVK